jgi:hypothetical protein
LVNIEKTDIGDVEDCGRCDHGRHRISSLFESLLVFSLVVEPEGHTTFSKVPINTSIFMQEDPFPDYPDDEGMMRGLREMRMLRSLLSLNGKENFLHSSRQTMLHPIT